MAVLMILTLVFVRNLKLVPTGSQRYVEAVIGFLNNFFKGILGSEGKKFFPFLGTLAIYIAFANLSGLVGYTSPTKDLRVTAGLAILSICVIEYSGIHEKGFKGWLKSFLHPMPILLPINILELFIRPLSLCMRLFGNVLGSFIIMEMLKIIAEPILPVPFSFYFDIFDGLIQTYVFVFLTSLFMKEKME
jgi:F-type H+-transporting ATPase subunit a